MRKIFFFLLLASFALSANAQTGTKKRCAWGVRSGLNFSKLRVDEGVSADPLWKTGFAFGVFFKVKASENLAFQPEFQYSSLGGNFEPKEQNPRFRLNYFSVPLLANIKAAKKVSFVVGPQVDFLIQAKSRFNGYTVKSTGDFKDVSFGATGGFEYWPLKMVGLSARYHHGLSKINDEESGSLRSTELQNQAVQLSLALKF